jgi:hypothetical protein
MAEAKVGELIQQKQAAGELASQNSGRPNKYDCANSLIVCLIDSTSSTVT